MKLFNIFPKYLTEFNYAGLNLNETPTEIEQFHLEFENFWNKECKDNRADKNCLFYCH